MRLLNWVEQEFRSFSSATMNLQQFEIFSLLGLAALMATFQEAFSSIGMCGFHMYLYKTRVSCEKPFYQGLMLGYGNCSDQFETLISCIKSVTRVCEHSWRSDAWIDLDVRLKFRKQFYCQNGALILPMALCGKKYYERGPCCVRSFRRKFRNNITDPSLCEEFSKAKTCIKELFEEECPAKKNSRSLYLNVLFDGYNPFCENNNYHPPTTVTTLSVRKIGSTASSLRSESSKATVGRDFIARSSTGCYKLSQGAMFKHLIALLCLRLI